MATSAPNELVRIARTNELDALICRIHMSTNDCIVISELSESLDLDGICIIPTSSVRYFDRVFERADFYQAALTVWSDTDPHRALIDKLTCDMATDLRFFRSRADMISVQMELEDPEIAYVGTVQEVTATELLLDRVSSRGRPIEGPLRVKLDAITKIETATRYLTAAGQAVRVLSKSITT